MSEDKKIRNESQCHSLKLSDNEFISDKEFIGHDVSTLNSNQKYIVLNRLNYDGAVSMEDLPRSAKYMLQKIEELHITSAVDILKKTVEEFKDDFNFSDDTMELIEQLLEAPEANSLQAADGSKDGKVSDWQLEVRIQAAIIEYHSPYPEVRSVVDPYDVPEIPCETLRAYVLGVIWVAIGAVINQFFAMRQPAIVLGPSVVQLLLYPCGLAWSYIVPDTTIRLRQFSFRLSPGPWTFKEQMFATIMYSVFGGTQYVTYSIYAQKVPIFFGNRWANWGYQILLALATNLLGFGFAGVLRRFACYPVKAIWPTVLPTLALNRALLKPETKENINGWTISRYRFFFIVFAASFVYFWIPNFLFNALVTFNWMTWIKQDNLNLAVITGSIGGLGLNPVPTFDLSTILFSFPLVLPFWSQLSSYSGMLLGLPIIAGLWWTNNKWTGFLPINSNGIFDNTGSPYQVENILDDKGLFNQLLYDVYGPPFYSAGMLVFYGGWFTIYPFSIIYETIIRWKFMKETFANVFKTIGNWNGSVLENLDDPQSRMMSKYKEVPDWCYIVILVVSFAFAVICVEVYGETQTPVWGIAFAIAINFVFLIPLTSLESSTGYTPGLNVLVQLIIGYALPGNSQALMIVQALGYNIDAQAQNYVADQKLGHYAKIPPRALFRGQILAVLVGTFVSLAIVNFQIDGGIKDFCSPLNTQRFTCPGATTYFSSTVLWGTIGPKRVFSGLYPVLQYCFLIGFVLVFPCLAIKWYSPKAFARKFQPTVLLTGLLQWAPFNLSYFTGSLYISFAFMYYIKKRYLAWWEKYNFVLFGALTSGVAFSSIIMFFAVQYNPVNLIWWGNTVSISGLDALSPARLNASLDAPDGYFGPRIEHFP